MSNIIDNAADYIVINDGMYRYPVLRSVLRPGDTEESVKAMSGDEYSDWCQAVPAYLCEADVGTPEMIELCDVLLERGAEYWNVG